MAESPVLRGAIERLRAGDSFGAETVAADAVRAAERRFGATSPAYAAAQFDLAHVLGAIGDFTRAADALRAACGVVPTDAESQKARLTYLMNLGDFLIRTNRHSR